MDKFSALGMFVATAEQGSFSRAAELLGKTPSALTKAVGHLERELGAQLFERSTRRIVLTEAGRLYLDTARQVLQRLHEAGEEIGQLQFVQFGGPQAVLKQGNNLYFPQNNAQPQPASGEVQQGMLERSNVNTVSEMVNLIANYRVYEANSKAVTTQDAMLDKSVNEVGRL